MNIQLSEHFTYKKLLQFILPSVVMMIFTSIYGVVDGLFVSNLVGKTPFAALNLIFPVLMILGAIGFMIGTGGSAIVAMTLGQGRKKEANQYFSMLVYVTVLGGVLLAVIGLVTIRPVAGALGAKGEMLTDCVKYAGILLPAMPAFMLQNVFQSFLITAQKPKMGLWVTVAAGLTNVMLDALFIAGFHWGLAGAALATAASQVVGGVIPVLYLLRENDSALRLTKAGFYGRILLKTCTNGSSELLTNISMSLVNILYNFQLLRLAGENGVAAFGVIMYANFIFVAMFLGYSLGCAPIIAYHFGAKNEPELKNLYQKSLRILGAAGVIMTVLAEILASVLARIFVGYDPTLYAMTCRGFRLYAISFLLCGLNIFGSAFFTALNNGAVSAILSFLRTLVFQIVAVLLLPLIWGTDGIWLAIVAAELLAFGVTIGFFVKMKGRYHYA
ncbi:MAG: MATE family efflux transporter [Blautia sp.]